VSPPASRAKRKIIYALKYFAELGLDYDFTTGENANWWTSRIVQERLQQQEQE
jgi:hypothetical protein